MEIKKKQIDRKVFFPPKFPEFATIRDFVPLKLFTL